MDSDSTTDKSCRNLKLGGSNNFGMLSDLVQTFIGLSWIEQAATEWESCAKSSFEVSYLQCYDRY